MKIDHTIDALVIDMPPPAAAVPVSAPDFASWVPRAILSGVIILMAGSILAFGATEAWSQFIQRTTVLVLLGVWAAYRYRQGTLEFSVNLIYLPAALFFCFILLQLVSGQTSYRYATLDGALNYIAYGGLLLLAGELFIHRRPLRKFVLSMAVFGLLLSVFAILQGLSGTHDIYWLRPVHAISAAIYGPYVNHNHYAGVMEMLTPLAVAAAFMEAGAKRFILFFAATTMALSIIFSGSRGGMLGSAGAVIFVFLILFRSNRRHRGLLSLPIFAAVIVSLTLWLGTDKALSRLAETQDNYRSAIYKDSLNMWTHRPVFGFGLGTFGTLYPQYRSFSTDLLVHHAHNDYLELLVETGLVGFALGGWFLFGVFRAGFRKIQEESDREGRLLTLALLSGIVAILVHSFLDFNLHIPANAALFYVMCAAIASPFKRRIRTFEKGVSNHHPEGLVSETVAVDLP